MTCQEKGTLLTILSILTAGTRLVDDETNAAEERQIPSLLPISTDRRPHTPINASHPEVPFWEADGTI